MATDILSSAVKSAIDAVRNAAPSQAPIVSVEGVRANSRQIRGTVNAVTTSAEFTDPIGEQSIASTIKETALLVASSGDGGWFDTTDPQAGDILTFEDGSRYSITAVKQTRGLFYKITARQC